MTSQNGRVLVNELHDHILCHLCRGYLIDATTLTRCLHSFCRSCIRRHLATTRGRHCPRCVSSDVACVVKPKMRRDRTLQRLVYKMVPGLLQDELNRRQLFASGEQAKLMTSSTELNTVKSLNGAELSSYQLFTNQETYNVCLHLFTPPSATDCDKHEDGDGDFAEILSSRFLLCPASFTVQLLKKFVRLKLDLHPAANVDIAMSGEILCENYTLTDLAYIFKHSNDEPLTMHYILNERTMASLSRHRTTMTSTSSCENATERISVTAQDNVILTSKKDSRVLPDDAKIPKKRGRKPKIRRFPRSLKLAKVQESIPVQVPSAPLSVGVSTDNSELIVVVKRKRGRPRKYNIEPLKAPPVEEPEVSSQQTEQAERQDQITSDANDIRDCVIGHQIVDENRASYVNDVIDHMPTNMTGYQTDVNNGSSIVFDDVIEHERSRMVEQNEVIPNCVDNSNEIMNYMPTQAADYRVMGETFEVGDHLMPDVTEHRVVVNENNVSNENGHFPVITESNLAFAAEDRMCRKRKSTAEADADDEETGRQATEGGAQMRWKVAAQESNQNEPIPRIKMTSVRMSRDKSAAAKWLVRPGRESRQVRKRSTGPSSGKKQPSEAQQGQDVLVHGGSHSDVYPVQNANNWIPSSLCSAVASWNAAALASAQLRRANDAVGGNHVNPMTSPQQTAFNGLTRLPDFSSMFNYAHMSPSAVTINDVGSEVMFVVGSDRRLSAVPMKIGERIQFDQSNVGVGGDAGMLLQQSRTMEGGGITGTGRVATVRPLEHAKLASHILTQRTNSSGEGTVVLDHRNGQSVVLVSTLPSTCVLAESLTKDHPPMTGVQTSTTSSAVVSVMSKATVPTGLLTSLDQRADDCSEITSTVADDACVALPQSPTRREPQQRVVEFETAATVCSEEKSATVEVAPVDIEQLSNDSTMSETAATTTTDTQTSSSGSPLVQNNSVFGTLNRPKPKKSLETVINLLKRPVSSDVSSLSLAVVDRVLSSLTSSGSDTNGLNRSPRSLQNVGHDVTVSSISPLLANQTNMSPSIQARLPNYQPPMTSSVTVPQTDMRLPSSRNNLVVPPGGEFSYSIKRLKSMCNSMEPHHVTTQWQAEVRATGPRPQWTSFYQPTLNGSWLATTSGERLRQDTNHCAPPKQQQAPSRHQLPPQMTARTVVENQTRTSSAGYTINTTPQQLQQLNNGGWRV